MPGLLSMLGFLSGVPGGGFDNSENTNGSNQQGIIYVGDSMLMTSESLEAGPEPFRTGIVYKTDSVGSTITEVTTTDVQGVTNGSPWPKFGVDYYKRSQYKAVICNCGVGGSEVHNNGTPSDNWSSAGTLRGNAITKVNNMLTAIGTTKPRMGFVSITINDIRNLTTTENQIETGFISFCDWIVATWPGVKFYFYLPGLEGNGTIVSSKNTNVRAMMQTVIPDYSDFTIIGDFMDYVGTPTSTLYQPDFLHLPQMGNDLLASTLVKDLLTLGDIKNNPLPYNYSDIAAVSTILGFPNFADFNEEEKKATYDYAGYLQGKNDLVKYDSIHCYLYNTQTKADQDMRRSAKQLNAGGAVWANKSGYTTDGTNTGVIRSNFIPSTDATAGGFASNNNVFGVFMKNRASGTGVKRTLAGAIANTVNRHHYMAETDGLGQFIQVNDCGTETAGTPAVGSALLFDGNRLWLNRRSGIGAHAMFRYPATYVSGGLSSVGHCDREFIIGGINNNGTYDEFIAGQFYGHYLMNGGSTEYIRGARKFREFCIDLLIWA